MGSQEEGRGVLGNEKTFQIAVLHFAMKIAFLEKFRIFYFLF